MGETCVRCGISPATSLVCPGSHRSRRDGFEVRELEGLLYESYGNAWEVRESAQLFQSTRLRPQTVTGTSCFLALRMVAPVPERGLR